MPRTQLGFEMRLEALCPIGAKVETWPWALWGIVVPVGCCPARAGICAAAGVTARCGHSQGAACIKAPVLCYTSSEL